MIWITITPKKATNLYGLLVAKEVQLRQHGRDTLHRRGGKKRGDEKWVHSSYPGWVRFQKCLGGVVVAAIRSKNGDAEWQLLTSFIGFVDRHFRADVASITLSYEASE